MLSDTATPSTVGQIRYISNRDYRGDNMNDKQFIKSFTIKEQAYLIVVGLTGSWMYDATYKELEQEEYCQNIVDQYFSNYAEQSLNQIALYAKDTISRCNDCGGRILFTCGDCV